MKPSQPPHHVGEDDEEGLGKADPRAGTIVRGKVSMPHGGLSALARSNCQAVLPAPTLEAPWGVQGGASTGRGGDQFVAGLQERRSVAGCS